MEHRYDIAQHNIIATIWVINYAIVLVITPKQSRDINEFQAGE